MPDMIAIKDRWMDEVYGNAGYLDPYEDYVWSGVLLGFLIGAGVSADEAQAIAEGAPGNGWEI